MRSTLCAVMAILLTLPVPSIQAQERSPFQVGDIRAASGQRSSGFLEIPGGLDEGAQVPITVIHGRGDGPVLGLIAGTHGYEYAPILALQKRKTASGGSWATSE